MSNRAKSMTSKTYWRSFGDRSGSPTFRRQHAREFPEGAETIEMDGVSRRGFMGIMGASVALAGGAACVRKPAQYILPYAQRPEDLVPGRPRYFASNVHVAGDVASVLVKSQDGRPAKIEGNPGHTSSQGSTDAWTQALVLGMYDPERSRTAWHDGAEVSLDQAIAGLHGLRDGFGSGAGVALLMEHAASPTLKGLVDRFTNALPQARVFVHDDTRRWAQLDATTMVAGAPQAVSYDTGAARVIVAVDSDLLGVEAGRVSNTRGFADGRRLEGEHDSMNRLYAVEPVFTVTGASADHRLQLPASQAGEFLKALAEYVFAHGVSRPAGLATLAHTSSGERFDAWVAAVGDDLVAHRNGSLVAVGDRQPAWVHALAFALNSALGNVGQTVFFRPADELVVGGDMAALASAIGEGSVSTLLIVGSNPVHSAPGSLDVATLLGSVETTVHLGLYRDETGALCDWHVPMSHALEAWGDAIDAAGHPGIQQPLIEPLYPSLSPIEFMAHVLPGESQHDAYQLVREHWRTATGVSRFDTQWQRWLHGGMIDHDRGRTAPPDFDWSGVAGRHVALDAPEGGSYEVVFALDSKVIDGRYANNAWLQELPEPLTKMTWDNAALVGVRTADALGLQYEISDTGRSNPDVPVALSGQLVADKLQVSLGGRSVTLPAMVTPGVPEGVIVLPLGYGRSFGGSVADGVGVNVNEIRTDAEPWIALGAQASRVAASFEIATTQDHGLMEGRPLVREADLQSYRQNPDFVLDAELLPDHYLHSLWEEPNPRDGQQWGMSIDLTTCTGCNTCTIACQAENNIPVVGKERILQGREMHWIRLDRYYSGDAENPEAVIQPVACMHCENAPCEQVCPVAATVHGPEGTNDMAYNRCIGTRYCANNCPFKVRRFNFFNFNRENDRQNPNLRLQRNTDVTVRFRGVMEKCTYCIQRINRAKIDAKVNGTGVVQDGQITPACGQACPSQAIVFGDINDPNSRVSQAKRRNRDYALLSWLNVHPRTTYLARIRNLNPALV